MSRCCRLKDTDLNTCHKIHEREGRSQPRHNPSQSRAVPAHLLPASTRQPRCFCPVAQASYSSSIQPALPYRFHLRLQIQKLPPLTAKKKQTQKPKQPKPEVRAQSAATLGEPHGDIPQKILQRNSLEDGLLLP